MKSKTEMMKRLRKERKAAGLVECKIWVTQEHSWYIKRHYSGDDTERKARIKHIEDGGRS